MSTHNISFLNIKKKIILNYPKSATLEFFQRAQERVGTSRGKRAVSVRALKLYCIQFQSIVKLTYILVIGASLKSIRIQPMMFEIYLTTLLLRSNRITRFSVFIVHIINCN